MMKTNKDRNIFLINFFIKISFKKYCKILLFLDMLLNVKRLPVNRRTCCYPMCKLKTQFKTLPRKSRLFIIKKEKVSKKMSQLEFFAI